MGAGSDSSMLGAYLIGVGLMGMTATGLHMADKFDPDPLGFSVFALLAIGGAAFAHFDVEMNNE